jgi:hypothetical protein
MKLIRLVAALAFAATATATAFAAEDHAHETRPLQGGVVSVVKDIEYELVARPDTVQLHLRDHGKPVDLSKTTAKLTLLSGADKQDVELKPAGGNKLEAKGSFKVAANTKVLALVTRDGQSSTARFVLK